MNGQYKIDWFNLMMAESGMQLAANMMTNANFNAQSLINGANAKPSWLEADINPETWEGSYGDAGNYAESAGNKVLGSVDDIVSNPKSLFGKSKADVAKILGDGWSEGAYGSSKTGWKFTKGDQSIFYHPGGGRHGGSYYGYSSGATGKIKIVGPDYVPLPGDKATIIVVGN